MTRDPDGRRTTVASVVRALTWLALAACVALASAAVVTIALDDALDPALVRLLLADLALGVVAGLPAPATVLFAAERRGGRLTAVDGVHSGRVFRAALGRILLGVAAQVLVGLGLLAAVDDPGGWAPVALVGVPLAASAAAVVGLVVALLVLKPLELLVRAAAGRLGLGGSRVAGPSALMGGILLAVVPLAVLFALMTGEGRGGLLVAVLMLLGLVEPVDATAAWVLRALVVAAVAALGARAVRRASRRAGPAASHRDAGTRPGRPG